MLLHKYLIKFNVILAFFIGNIFVYAMEEDQQYTIYEQTREKSSRLHLPIMPSDDSIITEHPSENTSKYFITDNQEDFTDRQTASSIRKNRTEFDEERIKKFIEDCPEKLKFFIKTLKKRVESGSDLYQKEQYDKAPFIALVGPPGTGKTSLAFAIPQYCKLKYTPIKATTLGNQYQHSAESKLNDIFNRVLCSNDPHVIILDEMQKIIKHDQNEDDNNAASVLWQLLDEIKDANNIVFIGTANSLKGLPKQLRQRLSNRCYSIELPNYNERIKNINYHIARISQFANILLTQHDISILAIKTDGLAFRDFDEIFEEVVENINMEKQNQNNGLPLTKKDILQAIDYIKKNNGIYKSWQTKTYEFIKPAIVPTLQIGIPVLVTFGFNYWLQMQAAKMQREMHLSSLEQNTSFHNDSVKQHTESMSQSERFYNETKLINNPTGNYSLERNVVHLLFNPVTIGMAITLGGPVAGIAVLGGIFRGAYDLTDYICTPDAKT